MKLSISGKTLVPIFIVSVILLLTVIPAKGAVATKDKIAVLIDSNLYSQVSEKFDLYIEDVEKRFPVHLIVHRNHTWNTENHDNIRLFLIQEYENEGIKGALLVGHIPFALWKQSWPAGTTNRGISSIFYEDMDGDFLDTNSDGMYNFHVFGPNEGPEIWVCWMRPPASNPSFYLNRLFDKAHDYYTGVVTINPRGFVACHDHYDNNFYGPLGTVPPMENIYGAGNVDKDGEGADNTIKSEIHDRLINTGYEMFDTWQHASSTLQQWDSGYTYSSEIMNLTNGSLMTFIYGCNSANFWSAPGTSTSNVNIANAYVFGTSKGQAATGTSWSYGSEYKYLFINAMGYNDHYLGEAWFAMESYVETASFVQSRYPDRNPGEECAGNNLLGNPFLIVKYSATGDMDGDGIPDWFEYRHRKPTVHGATGLNRKVFDSHLDADDDGLTNLEEYLNETDPTNPDTDGDGMPDGWEVDNDLDPLVDDAEDDPDDDGFTNYQEFLAGTDPQDPDCFFAVAGISKAVPDWSAITVSWRSAPDKWYAVQYSDDEFGESMNWQYCGLVYSPAKGIASWTDTGDQYVGFVKPNEVPHRHYKVEVFR